MKPSKISSLSNIFTSFRVALLPLLIISEMRDRIGLSFVLLIAIGLSDVFDGLSARWNEGQSPFGAVFDLAADFTVIFTLFVFYYIEGTFPLFLLILAIMSFSTFSIYCVTKGRVCKNTVGQYTGAVLYGSLLLIFFMRLFLNDLFSITLLVTLSISSLYLVVSIIENVILLLRKQGMV